MESLRLSLRVSTRRLRRRWSLAAVVVLSYVVTCSIVYWVAVYIKHELSYDTFHRNSERIVRITSIERSAGSSTEYAYAPLPLANALAGLADVEATVTINGAKPLLLRTEDDAYYQDGVVTASSNLFSIFDFELLRGDRERVLSRPFTIVITEALSDRLFGTRDPIGEVISLDGEEYEVTGIAGQIPTSSHIQFEAVRSWATYPALYGVRASQVLESWNTKAHTYALLHDGTSRDALKARIQTLLGTLRPENASPVFDVDLQQLERIHLYSNLQRELQAPGDLRLIYVLGSLVALLLIVAGANHVNIMTAGAIASLRQIGISKAIGGAAKHLTAQVLCESSILALLGGIVGLGLAASMEPSIEQILGRDFEEDVQFGILVVLLVAVITSGLGALYPSVIVASVDPVKALRSAVPTSSLAVIRKSLVGVQLTIAIGFLVVALVAANQFQYVHEKEPGFEIDNLITLPIRDSQVIASSYGAIRQELAGIHGVHSVTGSFGEPGIWAPEYHTMRRKGDDNDVGFAYFWYGVDETFIETYGLQITQGRDFRPGSRGDAESSVVINEAAANALGWEDPIGRVVDLGLNGREATIIGVVEDFHHRSLIDPIAPVAIYIVPSLFYSSMGVRLSESGGDAAIPLIKNTWREFFPDQPFDYAVLKDAFVRQHGETGRLVGAATLVSLIALVMAALGLLSMASVAAEKRRKEFAIRRLFGATKGQILAVVLRGTFWLVALSTGAGILSGYIAGREWLELFAYRAGISGADLLIAAALSVTISIMAAVFELRRASHGAPITVLRAE